MTCSQGCCPTQREHYRSIGFAPSAMPSRHPQAVEVNEREKRWDRDMPAYKTLRKQGLQPRGIDGSADLATRASSQQEIEYGAVLTKEQLPQALHGIEIAKQIREDAESA